MLAVMEEKTFRGLREVALFKRYCGGHYFLTCFAFILLRI